MESRTFSCTDNTCSCKLTHLLITLVVCLFVFWMCFAGWGCWSTGSPRRQWRSKSSTHLRPKNVPTVSGRKSASTRCDCVGCCCSITRVNVLVCVVCVSASSPWNGILMKGTSNCCLFTLKVAAFFAFSDAQPRKHCAFLRSAEGGTDRLSFSRVLLWRRALRPDWWGTKKRFELEVQLLWAYQKCSYECGSICVASTSYHRHSALISGFSFWFCWSFLLRVTLRWRQKRTNNNSYKQKAKKILLASINSV